jgi:hypothetical protein
MAMQSSLRRRTRGDDGSAMIVVMALSVVLTVIAYTLLNNVSGSMQLSRGNQDFQAAIQAADAAVEDYVYRINSDSSYVTYTNVAKDCFGAAAPARNDLANPAMNGWTKVPGGTTDSEFRYTVDNSKFCTDGVIVVTAIGKVKNKQRTEVAQIKRQGFLDFLYFTNIEVRDPALYTTNPFAGRSAFPAPDDNPGTVCGRRYYQPTASGKLAAPRPDVIDNKSPGCDNINFGGGDVIKGPLHTNDAMLVCGDVTFQGKTTTSWSGRDPSKPKTNLHWRANGGCTNKPNFSGNVGAKCLVVGGQTNDACYNAPLQLPPSNSQLKAETDSRVTNPAGCLFTGPTQIVLLDTGKMQVWSPNTDVSKANPGCALDGTTKKATLAIPTNGVVYVEDVPSTQTPTACTTGNGVWFDKSMVDSESVNKVVSTTFKAANRVQNLKNPVGYPIDGDWTKYSCTAGDAFVSGKLNGRLTIGAAHDLVVTDHVSHANGLNGTDSLGLIANNYVEVFHPVTCSGFDNDSDRCRGLKNLNLPGKSTPFNDAVIQAAILSVQHSFRVQNYQYGSMMGKLHATGAIAQNFRGIVALQGTSGYVKNYVYDNRLKYSSPPKFIDPVAASFSVAAYSER